MNKEVENLFNDQLNQWKLVGSNYEALSNVLIKEFDINGHTYRVQFNPARIHSSTAKVDQESLLERKCFLCAKNRPVEQKGLPFGTQYQILVNPYPIFNKHFTIPTLQHINQHILGRLGYMLNLCELMNEYVVFYNGPRCGASAPDHHHFQAGNKGFLPIQEEWSEEEGELIVGNTIDGLWFLNDTLRTMFVIEATHKEKALELFNILYQTLSTTPEEPMMNILAWRDKHKWIIVIFPRQKHRPSCYSAAGEANLLVSPGSVDMGGVIITPLEKDFDKITAKHIADILKEVSLPHERCVELITQIKK